jgi:hypothetical protein
MQHATTATFHDDKCNKRLFPPFLLEKAFQAQNLKACVDGRYKEDSSFGLAGKVTKASKNQYFAATISHGANLQIPQQQSTFLEQER